MVTSEIQVKSKMRSYISLLRGQEKTDTICSVFKSLGSLNWDSLCGRPFINTDKKPFEKHMPSDPAVTLTGIYYEKAIKNVGKRLNSKNVHCSTIAKRWNLPNYPIIEDLLSTLWHNETPCSHLRNVIDISLLTWKDVYVTSWMKKPVYRKLSMMRDVQEMYTTK